MHVERMRVSALILVGVVPLSIVVACGAAEEDSAAIGAGGVNGDAGATTGESDTDASRTSPPGAEYGRTAPRSSTVYPTGDIDRGACR